MTPLWWRRRVGSSSPWQPSACRSYFHDSTVDDPKVTVLDEPLPAPGRVDKPRSARR